MEVHHLGLLGAYVRKNDMSANPQLDLDDVDCDDIIHLHEARNKVEEKDLEARFYRYGVRPEYLQIQRILNCRLEIEIMIESSHLFSVLSFITLH